MKDVEYEKTKVDKVYEMTEHALQANEQLDMMLDRLKMVQQIHEQSPNLNLQIDKIKAYKEKNMPEALTKESDMIGETKACIMKELNDIQSLF